MASKKEVKRSVNGMFSNDKKPRSYKAGNTDDSKRGRGHGIGYTDRGPTENRTEGWSNRT